MVKTILVPTSGSETDAVVFETALAAARPSKPILSSITSGSARVRR